MLPGFFNTKNIERDWRHAAATLGLFFQRDVTRRPRISGELEGHPLRVVWEDGKAKLYIGGISPDLVLGKGRDRTGDPTFDGAIRCRFESPYALGLLGAATRKRILEIPGIRAEKGEIYYDLPPWRPSSRAALVSLVEGALELAKQLRSPVGPEELPLFQTFRDDTLDSVRRYNLEVLFREYPGFVADKAAKRAKADADGRIRIMGGAFLGENPDVSQLSGGLSIHVAGGELSLADAGGGELSKAGSEDR